MAKTSQAPKIPFWQDPHKRGIFFQFVAATLVALVAYYLYSNTAANMARQNIASGFGFLKQEAGFELAESIIEYWSDDSYQRALIAGVLNTFKIALVGNFLAILIGTLAGVLSLSRNWMVSRLMRVYIDGLRNIPLLLQLFFWYAMFTDIFPAVKEAYRPLKGVFLSQRGLYFTVFASHPIWKWVMISFVAAILFVIWFWFWCQKRQESTGQSPSFLKISLSVFLGLPLLVWLVGGAPHQLDIPVLRGFNFTGGYSLSPEFLSLLLGLVLYTGTFIAEIVRAGILSVNQGQWEAAESLGLSRSQSLGLVILPQALRVIVPPLTSQILNLTKNSSLAVAIAYPDFVAVANTTMNQTGQAIELVALIMIVYLFFSLSTSLFMNWYNKKIQLAGR